MTSKLHLPATKKLLLRSAITVLVVLYALLGTFLMYSSFVYPTPGKLVLIAGCVALAYGLWRLHPLARIGSLLFLSVAIGFLLIGHLDPYPSIEAEPGSWSLAWVGPSIIALLLLIYVLAKHKPEFRGRRDAL